jgi:hypothetical protein
MAKGKIAVYTAIFGSYDIVREPEENIEDIDYFCYTDNSNIKIKYFKIIKCKRFSMIRQRR